MQIKIVVKSAKLRKFDLTKEGSDFSVNQLVLNSIIGTLVKFGPSGRIEPYLAEKWEVSPDKRLWKFKFRKNLRCEDGKQITPALFAEVLSQNLKEYAQKGSVLMFDHLKGWENFIRDTSNSLLGLKASEDYIEFHFEKNPDEFLEILRMPYFGLWRIDPANKKIISSGPYSLKRNEENNVDLKLRDDWFTITASSTKNIQFSFIDITEVPTNLPDNTIIQMPFYVNTESSYSNSYWVISPPTMLDTFVLSPYKDNFFNHKENRKVFLNRAQSLGRAILPSISFYPTAITQGLGSDLMEYKYKQEKKKLTFALERTNFNQNELETINKIVHFSLLGSNVDFEIVPRDVQDPKWFEKTDSNNYFDARIASVDIGAYPIYSAIKMMFCTKLGVNFPEHGGQLCKIVEEGISSETEINQQFIDKFNKILNDEAIIIPIKHHSPKWLVSNSIDPQSLPATTPYPQFELIKMR